MFKHFSERSQVESVGCCFGKRVKHGLHSLDFIPINIHDLESIENLSFSFIKQDWFTAASNILQIKCACLEAPTGLQVLSNK